MSANGQEKEEILPNATLLETDHCCNGHLSAVIY